MGSLDIEDVYREQNRKERWTEATFNGFLHILNIVSDIPKKIGEVRFSVNDDRTKLTYLPRGLFGEGNIIVIPIDETVIGESQAGQQVLGVQPEAPIAPLNITGEIE